MKKFAYTLSAAALLAIGSNATAQSTACAVTAPAVQNGLCSYPIGGTIWTPAPPTQTSAVGLTNVEYLITKRNTPAMNGAVVDTTGGGGDVILGADADGIFDPSTMTRYGISLMAGDTFDVLAVGFNISQIKSLVNKIFTERTSTNVECCQVLNLLPDAAGFCDTLRNQGIDGQEDINTLSDVIAVFDAFSDRQLSAEGLVASMNTVNSQASNTFFPVECGRNDLPVCYGLDKNQRYGYVASSTIAVNKLSEVANFLVFPNPSNTGMVTVAIETKASTDLNVRLFNALGETIHNQQINAVMGAINVNFNTNGLTSGVYFIELADANGSQTSKVIIR